MRWWAAVAALPLNGHQASRWLLPPARAECLASRFVSLIQFNSRAPTHLSPPSPISPASSHNCFQPIIPRGVNNLAHFSRIPRKQNNPWWTSHGKKHFREAQRLTLSETNSVLNFKQVPESFFLQKDLEKVLQVCVLSESDKTLCVQYYWFFVSVFSPVLEGKFLVFSFMCWVVHIVAYTHYGWFFRLI